MKRAGKVAASWHGRMLLRASLILLVIATGAGQIFRDQPAGRVTAAVLATSAWLCPSATFKGRKATVEDGASTLERAAFRWLAIQTGRRLSARMAKRSLAPLGQLVMVRARRVRHRPA